MTNLDALKSNIEKLAAMLIHSEVHRDYDENLDGEWECCGEFPYYITSDDERFWDFEDALEHEISWLMSEVQDDTNR